MYYRTNEPAFALYGPGKNADGKILPWQAEEGYAAAIFCHIEFAGHGAHICLTKGCYCVYVLIK